MTHEELLEAFRTKKTLFTVYQGKVCKIVITKVELFSMSEHDNDPFKLIDRIEYQVTGVTDNEKVTGRPPSPLYFTDLFTTEEDLKRVYNL